MALATAPQSVAEPGPRRWKMSFEQFLEWDGDGDTDRRVEWVDGEAVELVYVTARHAQIVSFLFTIVGFACGAKGIGSVYGEPFVMHMSLTGNGRSPDLMIVKRDHADRVQEKYLQGPADAAIEVVSPGSTTTDYVVKLAEYRRAGVPEYWIIDPIAAQTTFLLLGEDGEYAPAPKDERGRFASPALDGLAVDPVWFRQAELPNVAEILKEWGLV